MANAKRKKPRRQPGSIKPASKSSGRQLQMQKKLEVKMKLNLRNVLVWLLIGFLILSFVFSLREPVPKGEKNLPDVLRDIRDEKVEEIKIEGELLYVQYKDGAYFSSRKEPQVSFDEVLKNAEIDPLKVNFEIKDQSRLRVVGSILELALPVVLTGVIFLWIFRQARGAQDSIFAFGRSKARLFAKGKQHVKFSDVGGVDEAKKELEEVVDFLKHPKKYRALGARTPKGVLLVGPSGTGKCVTGDTLIPTNRGLIRIDEVPKYFSVGENGQVFGSFVLGVDPASGKTRLVSPSHWYDLGEEETIKIETKRRQTIEGTKEHPLLTVNQEGNLVFKELVQLKKGDWLVLRMGDELFGNWEILNKDDAYILGLIIGDGGLTIKDRIYFSNSSSQLVKSFCDYFMKKFSYKPLKATGKYDWLVASRIIKQQLINLGLSEVKAGNKRIPESVLLAPKEIVVSFLQGLFDTDGSIDKRGVFEFGSTSETLARQVSALLLNLGIYHRFYKKGLNQHAFIYRLCVSGHALRVFSQKVGFRLKRKQQSLKDYIKTNKVNTNIRVFPYQGKRVKAVWESLKSEGVKPFTKVSRTFHKNLCRYANNTRGPSLNSLQQFVSMADKLGNDIHQFKEFKFLQELSLGKFVFDQVEKLSHSKGRVYDFTVPALHSFVAGGFVNHNTLLAQAVAGEAGVPFFSMAGSEFMEMLVGVGASVSGDTPVLIRKNGKIKLLTIADFVDPYCRGRNDNYVIPVHDTQTLGFEKKVTGFWGSRSNKRMIFDHSSWQPVVGVFRHRVDKIYEIEFLGGKIRTTGDHSVFVRKHGGIESIRVDRLKKGDVLVNLPMNTREWDRKLKRTVHKIKKHKFTKADDLYLDVWNEDKKLREQYKYALAQQGKMYQYQIAQKIGVCQMTVSNWQREVHVPQLLSRKLVKLPLPERVKVTPGLMKLFGYYTAEGRGTGSLEITFGKKEKKLIKDFCQLMEKTFGLKDPVLKETETNTIKIIYYSHHLGRFFSKYCGNGSHNKHVPSFVWDLPKDYFLAFLKGYTGGDGYITKAGKLTACSVSKQLILELAWLCSMHGIKAGIKHEIIPGGRVINDKSLPDCESWKLIIGKTSNPFLRQRIKYPYQFKRCYVRKITKKKFDGFVYDLCGVENEAFFGGEKPILLHNSRVRDLFSTAKKSSPSIIFIDEIDAIGRVRGLGVAGGHDEREQTLNQILVEMDGFTPNDNVIVISATNRGDLLDPALMRPGRFDRRVMLDLPDIEGRKKILKIHQRGKPFDASADWEKVAKRTVGFSGADLENMLNEAAILAARQNKKAINWDDIEEAATKVKLGPEKKRLQSDLDRKMTAYHEAGHAVISHNLDQMDPVHRVSIVSRGMALGYTLIPPKRDRIHETKTHLLQTIASLLGGRAAEDLVFKEFTSGSATDITQATHLARKMVIEFGMSDLGPINLGPQVDVAEWGKSFIQPSEISPEMAAKVDKEVKRIVDECYQRALETLEKKRKKMDLVANELLKKETIEGDEFKKLMES